MYEPRCYDVDTIFRKDTVLCYTIPKYQRDYTWGINEWRALYEDIMDSPEGYFLGTMICVSKTQSAFEKADLEVIDGQQRLTTLFIFLGCIYQTLSQYESLLKQEYTDWYADWVLIRRSLVGQKEDGKLRLQLQKQSNNESDLEYAMAQMKILPPTLKKPSRYGNRLIAKCCQYFLEKCIKNEIADKSEQEALKAIFNIYDKVKKATMVVIQVNNYSDAYILFESLNNRGVPLTAIELMKNLVFSNIKSEKYTEDVIDNAWQNILTDLTDDYATQERFFRQYYNAFKRDLNLPFVVDKEKPYPLAPMATKAKLLNIYEKIIKNNAIAFLENVREYTMVYSKLILSTDDISETYRKQLIDLSHIEGSTSYLLLLYLFKQKDELGLDEENLKEIVDFLTKFYVRRNLTDKPGTRDINRIFMSIVDHIRDYNLKGHEILSYVCDTLKSHSASNDEFKKCLEGDIYLDNAGVTRFILCALAEKPGTLEYKQTDLWKKKENTSKSSYIWTIEHIFPEGKTIPKCWVDMIANGDSELADKYREEYVHQLGNLTITAYNSSLGNNSFIEKRDYTKKESNGHGGYVKCPTGYNNGLSINEDLKDKDSWTIDDIKIRTEKLVGQVMEMFKL